MWSDACFFWLKHLDDFGLGDDVACSAFIAPISIFFRGVTCELPDITIIMLTASHPPPISHPAAKDKKGLQH